MRHATRGSSGQATVELAVLLPILLLLLVGLFEVVNMASALLTVQHSTREAVRLGLTGATNTQIVDRAMTTATGLDTSRMTVVISPTGARPPGSDITVQVTYRYQVLQLVSRVGPTVNLSSQLTARVE